MAGAGVAVQPSNTSPLAGMDLASQSHLRLGEQLDTAVKVIGKLYESLRSNPDLDLHIPSDLAKAFTPREEGLYHTRSSGYLISSLALFSLRLEQNSQILSSDKANTDVCEKLDDHSKTIRGIMLQAKETLGGNWFDHLSKTVGSYIFYVTDREANAKLPPTYRATAYEPGRFIEGGFSGLMEGKGRDLSVTEIPATREEREKLFANAWQRIGLVREFLASTNEFDVGDIFTNNLPNEKADWAAVLYNPEAYDREKRYSRGKVSQYLQAAEKMLNLIGKDPDFSVEKGVLARAVKTLELIDKKDDLGIKK